MVGPGLQLVGAICGKSRGETPDPLQGKAVCYPLCFHKALLAKSSYINNAADCLYELMLRIHISTGGVLTLSTKMTNTNQGHERKANSVLILCLQAL